MKMKGTNKMEKSHRQQIRETVTDEIKNYLEAKNGQDFAFENADLEIASNVIVITDEYFKLMRYLGQDMVSDLCYRPKKVLVYIKRDKNTGEEYLIFSIGLKGYHAYPMVSNTFKEDIKNKFPGLYK